MNVQTLHNMNIKDGDMTNRQKLYTGNCVKNGNFSMLEHGIL